MITRQPPLPIVVLISGFGSNLQAIIDAIREQRLPAEIRAVICNRPDAYGLERARAAGIPDHLLNHRDFSSREEFDGELQASIDRYRPALVVLAGFDRIRTPAFVDHYRGHLLNLHPSLLPAFPGCHAIEQALRAGVTEHGATVHFVTEEVDGGPIVLQARVPVLPEDTVETLAARVHLQEHRILPEAIRLFAEGRLHLKDDRAWLDDRPLS